ncbi:MAG: cation transporter [Bacteroidales bacterium]|nr:cation transporter [Bacteroidales bacterium]
MEHSHHHTHHDIKGKNLIISIILNLVITIAEVIGGLVSNSLALLSDALHNLGDTTAIFIAYVAHRISHKKHNTEKTFGYSRVEILAALFNAVVLMAIIIYLFIAAVLRLKNPEPVKGGIMLVVAVIGLIANLVSVLLLRHDSTKNINVKAAYLHLLGDTFSSLAVVAGALFIYFFKIYWIDAIITILVGLYLVKETFSIIRQAVDILMQAKPKGLDLDKVKKELEKLPEVDNIHHVHAWNLTDNDIHFECHLDLKDDLRISQTDKIKDVIHEILLNKFNITHVTIQYEFNCCENKEMIHSR